MLPTHVALVPYEDELVQPADLLRVAAALQLQLTRDFTPVWGTPAVLSAFTSLDDVPPACIPIVLVRKDTLLQREHAFHTTVKGQPIGLIEVRDGWEFAASHELLEIVCDPQGQRKVSGASMADSAKSTDDVELEAWAASYKPQGEVQYLLEVCDPCQHSHYMINGVKVSDFVTPRYYGPGESIGASYSFTGALKKPLELLEGGYITWYTSIKSSPVWQAKKKDGVVKVGPMTIPAPGSSRHDIDYASDVQENVTVPIGKPRSPKKTAPGKGAGRYGAELRADIADFLDSMYAAQAAEVELAKLVALLKDLAHDKAGLWTKSMANERNYRSRELGKRLGRPIHYPGGFPSQEQFRVAYEQARQLLERQDSMKVSGQFAALQMQGQT
jgi:hypothetical protein